MKKVLVSIEGRAMQIVDPGQEFEIYNGPAAKFVWGDVDNDNITLDWTLEWSPAQGKMIWIERSGSYTDPGMARQVAYGEVGEQLDMLYRDIAAGKSLDASDAEWYQHIKNIKSTYVKPVAKSVPATPTELKSYSETEEPGADKFPKMSYAELPAWKRYEGWTDPNA